MRFAVLPGSPGIQNCNFEWGGHPGVLKCLWPLILLITLSVLKNRASPEGNYRSMVPFGLDDLKSGNGYLSGLTRVPVVKISSLSVPGLKVASMREAV